MDCLSVKWSWLRLFNYILPSEILLGFSAIKGAHTLSLQVSFDEVSPPGINHEQTTANRPERVGSAVFFRLQRHTRKTS